MNKEAISFINTDFSRRITSLRFILAVLVVFIHSTAGENNQISFADSVVQANVPVYAVIVQDIFTNILGGAAVPLFFVISAYLFFAKPKDIKENIKSKTKSIVVPYIFWTVITVLLYFAAQSFCFSRNFFSKQENLVRSWHIAEYIQAFTGRKVSYIDYCVPLVYQFWYLRNLILFMMVSPIIKFLASRFPVSYFCVIFILSLLRCADAFYDPLWIFPAIFYFSMGFYAVKHIQKAMNFLDSLKWKDFISAYILFAAVSIYIGFAESPATPYIGFVRCILTIMLFIKAAGKISVNDKAYKTLSRLSVYSFWIYAAHAPFVVTAIKKIIIKLIPMNGGLVLVQFFLTAFLCIAFLMAFGILLKHRLPKIFALVTGSRTSRTS